MSIRVLAAIVLALTLIAPANARLPVDPLSALVQTLPLDARAKAIHTRALRYWRRHGKTPLPCDNGKAIRGAIAPFGGTRGASCRVTYGQGDLNTFRGWRTHQGRVNGTAWECWFAVHEVGHAIGRAMNGHPHRGVMSHDPSGIPPTCWQLAHATYPRR